MRAAPLLAGSGRRVYVRDVDIYFSLLIRCVHSPAINPVQDEYCDIPKTKKTNTKNPGKISKIKSVQILNWNPLVGEIPLLFVYTNLTEIDSTAQTLCRLKFRLQRPSQNDQVQSRRGET